MTFKTYFESNHNKDYKVVTAIGSNVITDPIIIPMEDMPSMSAAAKKYIDMYISYGAKRIIRDMHSPTNNMFYVICNKERIRIFIVSEDFPYYDQLRQLLEDDRTIKYVNEHGIESLYDFVKNKQTNEQLTSAPDAVFDKGFLDEL